MCKATWASQRTCQQCRGVQGVPSESHRSIVTLCLPTVRCVPGGSVPAGTLRAADEAAGAAAAVSELTLDRLAMDELCDGKGDAMATVIYGHSAKSEREEADRALASSSVPQSMSAQGPLVGPLL